MKRFIHGLSFYLRSVLICTIVIPILHTRHGEGKRFTLGLHTSKRQSWSLKPNSLSLQAAPLKAFIQQILIDHLLPDQGSQKGAVNKADRDPCPQGAPVLASTPLCQFAAARRHPLPFWAWAIISPGQHFSCFHSRGLFRLNDPLDVYTSRKMDIHSAVCTVLAKGKLSRTKTLSPTSIGSQSRAHLLSHHVSVPGTIRQGCVRHI